MQQKSIRTILITGANKGLGYGMVESLCKNNPLDLNIILGARDIQRGQEALQKLKQLYPSSKLQFLQIDIGNKESHYNFIKQLQDQKQIIDILVNNAAVLLGKKGQPNSIEESEETFNINYYGTIQFTKDVLPYLSNDARIINLGSAMGCLNVQGQFIQEQLNNPNITEENIDYLLKSYIKQLKGEQNNTDWVINGYTPAYSASKSAFQAYFRFIANKFIKKDQTIYNLSPGWCKTSMGGEEAEKTVEQGIHFTMELINNPQFGRDNKRHGLFFRDGQEINY